MLVIKYSYMPIYTYVYIYIYSILYILYMCIIYVNYYTERGVAIFELIYQNKK